MLPNNPNFSFSDLAFYSLQQRAPPPYAEITLESQAQLKEVTPTEAASTAGSTCQQRKRTYRSDRHSKIRTAQGERDRRMRLSVQVANQFFALQDRLGFDKASKTIDWLLTQAKDSIDELSSSSSSELSKEGITTDHAVITDQSPQSDYEPVHATTIVQKPNNKAEECQLKAKDMRAKARARARERVAEKKVASSKLDQPVPACDALAGAPMDRNCNSMEYYCYLLNDILNGGFCSVDIEDQEGTTSSSVQFN